MSPGPPDLTALDAPAGDHSATEARLRTVLERVPVSIIEEDWTTTRVLLAGLRAQGVDDGPAYFATHPSFVQACLRGVRTVRSNAMAKAWEAARQQRGDDTLATTFDSPQALAWFIDELNALWAGQRVYTAQRTQRAPDGQTAVLQVTVALPDLGGSGRAMALVSVTDVTEIQRVNAELDASLRRLACANQELEAFTYSVSHDLKAPLRGIDGYSRLLLRDHADALGDEGRQFLGSIRKAAHQMGELIEDLLSYSRLDRARLGHTPIAIRPLLEDLLQDVRDAHPTLALEVALEVPEVCTVMGDVPSLRMALLNLLDNAVKFTRPGQPPRIRLQASRDGGWQLLRVQDDGVGFDMKHVDRIFEIFQRLHQAEDYPGTGVGLALVRKAVARMGGSVQADSAPGQGAAFTLRLRGVSP